MSNHRPFRKRNPGTCFLALIPDRALERLYSKTLDKPHSMKFKVSQVPATHDGGMFWNGWYWVSRFWKTHGGVHIDVSGSWSKRKA